MNKVLISVDDRDRVVGYREAKWIVVYDMERRLIVDRVEMKDGELTLDLLIERHDPDILLTTKVSEEDLLMIEGEGVKTVLVKSVDLRRLIDELF